MRGCALLSIGLAVAAALTAGVSASEEIPAEPDITVPALSLRLPKEELVSFAGIANDDTVTANREPSCIPARGPWRLGP